MLGQLRIAVEAGAGVVEVDLPGPVAAGQRPGSQQHFGSRLRSISSMSKPRQAASIRVVVCLGLETVPLKQ